MTTPDTDDDDWLEAARDDLAAEFDQSPFMIEAQIAAQGAYPHPDAGPLWDAFEKGVAWSLGQDPTRDELEHAAAIITDARNEPHWAASRIIHDFLANRAPRHPERD